MEEKLIIIHDVDSDETLDSFVGTLGFANSSEYYLNNKLEQLDLLEFEAFIFVPVRFK